jgi:hypothetical protein
MATPTNLPAAQTTGNVLTAAYVNDLRGAFRVLQVVSGTTTTATSATIIGFVDSTLTATITPQSNTSKILVIINQSLFVNTASNECVYRLVRGSTTLQTQVSPVYSTGGSILGYAGFAVLDAPASTSALTYKTQIAIQLGVGSVTAQQNGNPANITLLEISA